MKTVTLDTKEEWHRIFSLYSENEGTPIILECHVGATVLSEVIYVSNMKKLYDDING